MVDAATVLASPDVTGIERAADLIGALLGAPVSAGFVSRCLVRLDAALITAGFEDVLKDALKAAGRARHRRDPGAADQGGNRTKLPITGFGILDGYRGVLVRDDYSLARLCHRYDQAVAAGISVNLSRRWHKGNHPGLILGWAAQAQGRPGLAIRQPLRRPRHEQRIRERRPRLQARREIGGC